jgi:hypothetical protein
MLDLTCLEPERLVALAAQGPLRRARSVPWHYYQNVVTPRCTRCICSCRRDLLCTTCHLTQHHGAANSIVDDVACVLRAMHMQL